MSCCLRLLGAGSAPRAPAEAQRAFICSGFSPLKFTQNLFEGLVVLCFVLSLLCVLFYFPAARFSFLSWYFCARERKSEQFSICTVKKPRQFVRHGTKLPKTQGRHIDLVSFEDWACILKAKLGFFTQSGKWGESKTNTGWNFPWNLCGLEFGFKIFHS